MIHSAAGIDPYQPIATYRAIQDVILHFADLLPVRRHMILRANTEPTHRPNRVSPRSNSAVWLIASALVHLITFAGSWSVVSIDGELFQALFYTAPYLLVSLAIVGIFIPLLGMPLPKLTNRVRLLFLAGIAASATILAYAFPASMDGLVRVTYVLIAVWILVACSVIAVGFLLTSFSRSDIRLPSRIKIEIALYSSPAVLVTIVALMGIERFLVLLF